MAATRVYILAKELGVKSIAIVSKCQEEGLDVKNHMSTISSGLAATIREWFSEGEDVSIDRISMKVDLEKVHVKPMRKKKAQNEQGDNKRTGPLILPESNSDIGQAADSILKRPKPAKLTGPQVVRIETPEPLWGFYMQMVMEL